VGFNVASCVKDRDTPPVTYPDGRSRVLWLPGHNRHSYPIMPMRFVRADGHTRAVRAQCTQSGSQPQTAVGRKVGKS